MSICSITRNVWTPGSCPISYLHSILYFAMLLHQIAKDFHLLFSPPTISTSHALTPSFTEICRYWFTHNLNNSLSYLTDFWQPEWSLKAHWHTLLVGQQCASHVSASPLMTNRNPAELCCGWGPHFSPHHLMPLFGYVLFSCQCWGLQHVQGAQPGVWQEAGGFITPSAFSKIQPINLTVWTAS